MGTISIKNGKKIKNIKGTETFLVKMLKTNDFLY
jgi:hypothetical protein